MDIRLLLDSVGPHCKPIKCGNGGRVFLVLKDGFEDRTTDGSGVIVATITSHALIGTIGGGGKWDYLFSIDQGEIAPLATVDANSIATVCCLECDTLAMLKKIKRAEARDFTVESFRVYGDDEDVLTSEVRLFRKHSAIEIQSMEISVARIISSYGYAIPGKLTVSPIITPEQAAGPFSIVGSGAAVIDPASSTPMTARYDFVPPLVIDGGRAFGVNIAPETEDTFEGLEVHLQFNTLGDQQ